MKNTKQQKDTPLTRLIPPELSHLVSDRPLAYGEVPDEYDKLVASIVADLDPRTAIETIMAKDLADWSWEASRTKKLRATAFEAGLGDAAWALLGHAYKSTFEMCALAMIPDEVLKEQLACMARKALRPNTPESETIHELCVTTGVTLAQLAFKAHELALPTITALEANLERLDRRRERLLRFYEERRATKAAMARSLLAREAEASGRPVTEIKSDAA